MQIYFFRKLYFVVLFYLFNVFYFCCYEVRLQAGSVTGNTVVLECSTKKRIIFLSPSSCFIGMSSYSLQRCRSRAAFMRCTSLYATSTFYRFVASSSLGIGKDLKTRSVSSQFRSPLVEDFFREPTISSVVSAADSSNAECSSPYGTLSSSFYKEEDTVKMNHSLPPEKGEEEKTSECSPFPASQQYRDLFFEESPSLDSSDVSPPSPISSRKSLKLLFSFGTTKTTPSGEKSSRWKQCSSPSVNSIEDNLYGSQSHSHEGSAPEKRAKKDTRDLESVESCTEEQAEQVGQEQNAEEREMDEDDHLSWHPSEILDDEQDASQVLDVWSSVGRTVLDGPSKRETERRNDEGGILDGEKKRENVSVNAFAQTMKGFNTSRTKDFMSRTISNGSTFRSPPKEDDEMLMDQLLEEEAQLLFSQFCNRGNSLELSVESDLDENIVESETGSSDADRDTHFLFMKNYENSTNTIPQDTFVKELDIFDKEAISVELETVGDKFLSKAKPQK